MVKLDCILQDVIHNLFQVETAVPYFQVEMPVHPLVVVNYLRECRFPDSHDCNNRIIRY